MSSSKLLVLYMTVTGECPDLKTLFAEEDDMEPEAA
jgi:hypothetical protein